MVKSLVTEWHLVTKLLQCSLMEWSRPFRLRPSEYRTSKSLLFEFLLFRFPLFTCNLNTRKISGRDGTLVCHPPPTLRTRVQIQAMANYYLINNICSSFCIHSERGGRVGNDCGKIERVDQHKSRTQVITQSQRQVDHCRNSPIESRIH